MAEEGVPPCDAHLLTSPEGVASPGKGAVEVVDEAARVLCWLIRCRTQRERRACGVPIDFS